MSMVRVYAAICETCGRDIAAVRAVGPNYEVFCSTEGSGCGKVGGLANDAAAAVVLWNNENMSGYGRAKPLARTMGVR